ncbi:pentatricopeptide repeat-containing protein At4g16470-like [Gastrolobium bilobum]|uniref:pentatricopeptide repeat-containing protein At4g16470-like n=1 Tax=Gastrolobium bilobum TaxID=150636 RepID=UPI002AB219BC|nr:pentatricopeptide repeat-containing protein At4g16470-like [Gastrolobium bilobum]
MLLAHIPFNRYTFPPLLKSCAKIGFGGSWLLKQIHGTIVVNGFASDLTISNALLFANTRRPAELLKRGRKLFDTMLKKNVITWSMMMKDDQEVDKLFDRMIEAGERPNDVTFYTILRACNEKERRVENGWEYFDIIEERFGLKPRAGHYAKIVDMLGWVGRVKEAAMLMLRMRREEVEPNDTAWSSFRRSCYFHRKMELYELVEFILKYYETKARDQGKLPYRQMSADDSMYGYSRYDVPDWSDLSMIVMIRSRKFLPIRKDFLSSEYRRM